MLYNYINCMLKIHKTYITISYIMLNLKFIITYTYNKISYFMKFFG